MAKPTDTEKLLDEIETNAASEGLELSYLTMFETHGNVEKLTHRIYGLADIGAKILKPEEYVISCEVGLKLGKTRATKDYKQLFKIAEYLRNL